MNRCTEKQSQWLWFIGLCCGGIAATMLLAYAVRWIISST